MSRTVAAAVGSVRARIDAAARRVGRHPSEVTLVGATKSVPPDAIAEAIAAGVVDLGENRAQELLAKAPELEAHRPRWHFIGVLQRNKVRSLAPWVSCWQTVDRQSLGIEIARRVANARVLVEVNLAGEAQKAGATPDQVPRLVDELVDAGHDVRGLMTIPPHDDEPRPWFARLRTLAERCGLVELSMGMSEDFEVAVEEGATVVRIGRAIFGER